MAQSATTVLLVALCAVYVGWALLLPSALRARLATAALRLPWPAVLRRSLQRQAAKMNGCGCDGCDKSTLSSRRGAPQAEKPVNFVRRSGR